MKTSEIAMRGFYPPDPQRLLNGYDARLRLAALSTIATILVQEVSQPITAATNYVHSCARRLGHRNGANEVLRPMIEDAAREMIKVGEIIRRMHVFLAKGLIVGRVESLTALIESVAGDQVCPDGVRARFETTIEPDADRVVVDASLIEHVLSILFAESCEAMDGRDIRTIAIRASRLGAKVALRITDSGPALTDYQFIHLFEPLLTVKSPRMGLGMPICKAIVESHGGRLWAESPAKEGATYGLSLPAAD